jgi:AraC family transcriptional regulator
MGQSMLDARLAATIDAVSRFADRGPTAQIAPGADTHLAAAVWHHTAKRGRFYGHQRHILAISLRGNARLEQIVDGRSVWRGSAVGSTVLVREGEDSDWLIDGPFEVLHVYLDIDELPEGARAPNLTRPFRDPVLFQLAHAAALAAREGAPAGGYVQPLLKSLQQRLIDHHFGADPPLQEKPGPGLSGAARLRVEALVRERLAGPVTAQELADVARLSLGHFNRAFRQTFGTSPHQYVINQRIAHASVLLVDTDLPIAEVARRSGFTSCSYFGAQFRRATGMSPGEYRRRA